MLKKYIKYGIKVMTMGRNIRRKKEDRIQTIKYIIITIYGVFIITLLIFLIFSFMNLIFSIIIIAIGSGFSIFIIWGINKIYKGKLSKYRASRTFGSRRIS